MNVLRPPSFLSACVAALIALPAATSLAQIESVTRITAAPARYERVDYVVMLVATWADPYVSSDVRLDLELTAPSGRTLRVPAYYERGSSGEPSVWRATYAPGELGRYTGRFVLTQRDQQESSDSVAFDVAPSSSKGFLRPGNRWTFRFDDGTPFRGIGENLGWEARAWDDSRHFKSLHENPRYNYEYLIGRLASGGGNFFRTWMCPWNLPLEWRHVDNTRRYTDDAGHFNASAVRRMDELLTIAEAADVYFMLTLDVHGGLMGESWRRSNYHQRQGGPVTDPAEFFSSPAARAQYRDRLRYLVARWGWSPRLAVWELFNEVDNAMYARKPARIPDDIVTAWHAEMSAYLKELDPSGRLVSTSISHRELAGLDDVRTLDFNQRHIYKHTDTIPDVLRQVSEAHGKPCVIGEFAYEWDWTKDFNEIGGLMDRDFKQGLWFGLFSPTPILPLSWWWEFFDQRGLPPYFARVRAIHQQMLAAGHGEFVDTAVRWEGAPLRHTLAVRCGTTTFVLLASTTTEPSTGRVTLPDLAARTITAKWHDPETETTRELPVTADGTFDALTVPAQGSLLLVVTER